MTRVESGKMNPTYDVVLKLLDAVGLDERFDPVSDPMAVATARWILGVGEEPPGADYWTNRWVATGALKLAEVAEVVDVTVPDLQTFAFRVGRAAPLAWRPKVVRVRQDRTWNDIADDLNRAGIEWAGTGDWAANRLVYSASESQPTFSVSDVDEVIRTLGMVFKGEREWGQPITLLPFDGFSEAERWRDDDGCWYAAPWQVILDCNGGSDRVPEQADRILETLPLTAAEEEARLVGVASAGRNVK